MTEQAAQPYWKTSEADSFLWVNLYYAIGEVLGESPPDRTVQALRDAVLEQIRRAEWHPRCDSLFHGKRCEHVNAHPGMHVADRGETAWSSLVEDQRDSPADDETHG